MHARMPRERVFSVFSSQETCGKERKTDFPRKLMGRICKWTNVYGGESEICREGLLNCGPQPSRGKWSRVRGE
jgi:hypothetical protein